MPDRFPSLRDDLSAEPTPARLQDCLRKLVEGGADPAAVADAALSAAAGLSIDVNGAAKTATMLLLVSEQLRQAAGAHRPGFMSRKH